MRKKQASKRYRTLRKNRDQKKFYTQNHFGQNDHRIVITKGMIRSIHHILSRELKEGERIDKKEWLELVLASSRMELEESDVKIRIG